MSMKCFLLLLFCLPHICQSDRAECFDRLTKRRYNADDLFQSVETCLRGTRLRNFLLTPKPYYKDLLDISTELEKLSCTNYSQVTQLRETVWRRLDSNTYDSHIRHEMKAVLILSNNVKLCAAEMIQELEELVIESPAFYKKESPRFYTTCERYIPNTLCELVLRFSYAVLPERSIFRVFRIIEPELVMPAYISMSPESVYFSKVGKGMAGAVTLHFFAFNGIGAWDKAILATHAPVISSLPAELTQCTASQCRYVIRMHALVTNLYRIVQHRIGFEFGYSHKSADTIGAKKCWLNDA